MNSNGWTRERQRFAWSANVEALREEELPSIQGGAIVQPSLVWIGQLGGPFVFTYLEGYAFTT